MKTIAFKLRKDMLASIIVFLVALPLCIGISIACNLPISTGIISAIIGGIVVGTLSGNSLQVSGPAAGLILVIVDIVQHNGIEKLGLIIFLAGIIQIVFGLFSLGKYFRAISPAIIQGMLTGIGISIFLTQFNIMLDGQPSNNFIQNIVGLEQTLQNSIFHFQSSPHHIAGLIGFLTIFIITTWKFFPIKQLRIIPSALIAIIISSLIVYIFNFNINHIEISDNFWGSLNILNLNTFHSIFDFQIIKNAFIVTLIASAETLLTSTAIDKISTNSKTDYNKEIFAQGVGNSLAGIFGGLPITGIIVRSVANIEAGAKTRFSSILHGVWILLFASLFPFILAYVPTASLAAILVYTGYTLIDIKGAKDLYSISKGEFAIFAITLISIISINLFEGILIGLIFAISKDIYKTLKINIKIKDIPDENKISIKLSGNITFMQIPQLADVLENLDETKKIEINCKNLYFIDHACIDFISSWEEALLNKGCDIYLNWDKIQKLYPGLQLSKVVSPAVIHVTKN
ncbi:MAG: SulP family inorganic anion transporter [bacterium]